jgi:orotidine-5'-phosphate decarboxylase
LSSKKPKAFPNDPIPKGENVEPKDRIILALDTDNRDTALRWVEKLGPYVGQFKVGLELINHAGFEILEDLRDWFVFYDAKFHDIPNTVAGAARGATRAGVWMFNVHATGGREMMEAAREAAETISRVEEKAAPIILGVTLLSSINTELLQNEWVISEKAESMALRLAKLTQEAGLDGVVAGGSEVGPIREACGNDFVIMTPGIRPSGSDLGDQKRILTPGDAIRLGSTYLGIGRPVTRAEDPVAAIKGILDEVAAAT